MVSSKKESKYMKNSLRAIEAHAFDITTSIIKQIHNLGIPARHAERYIGVRHNTLGQDKYASAHSP